MGITWWMVCFLLARQVYIFQYGNNTVVAPQPNADGTNGSPVSPPAPQPPSSQSSDAISIHSLSTDWEEEYGVTQLSSDATAAPSPIFPCGCTM